MDTAKNAVDIARNGATALNTAVGTIDTLKALFKSTEQPPIDDVRKTITDLNERILDAREANIRLRDLINDLRDEMFELKRREEKFAGYELWETPLGSHVYRSAPGVNPVHYLCPTCHDAGVKTILQGDRYGKGCNATTSHGYFDFEARPDLYRGSSSYV